MRSSAHTRGGQVPLVDQAFQLFRRDRTWWRTETAPSRFTSINVSAGSPAPVKHRPRLQDIGPGQGFHFQPGPARRPL